MVNHTQATRAEAVVLQCLKDDKRCAKYGFVLHKDGPYGIDIQATQAGYEDLAIEVENTEAECPADAPYPLTWKNGFTVPSRKYKFYESHPLAIYVKVNSGKTRAVVVPMAFVCSSSIFDNDKSANGAFSKFKCRDFFTITDPDHPGVAYIRMEDLPSVIDGLVKHLKGIRKLNAKYTDGRPNFKKEK